MMSLPRVLNLDTDGSLRMRVLPQAVTLRREPLEGLNSAVTLKNATGEMSCIGKKETDLEISVTLGSTELLRLKYSSEEHAWLMEGRNIALQHLDVPKVHAFVDGSVLELILSERVGYTKRFYYPGTVAPDITIRVTGTEGPLKGWTISPISDNRLTTMDT
jgi:beta-fructofuranosidase